MTPTRLALDADEAGQDRARESLLDFEEIALVGNRQDQFLHVIGLVGAVGDQRVEPHVEPLRIIKERPHRRFLAVGQRQEVEQPPHLLQRFDIIVISAVGDGRLGGVRHRAAQFLGRDDLVGDGFHHVRPGHEHVAGVAHHVDEIGEGRGIDRPARARAHDDRDLRHDAGSLGIAAEHFGIAGQRIDALLNARAAAVIQPDHRRAVFHRHVHDLADLAGMRFRQAIRQAR